jgi:hypothetical protein
MGAIARSAANLITTSGVVLKGAVNNDSFDNVTALPSALAKMVLHLYLPKLLQLLQVYLLQLE